MATQGSIEIPTRPRRLAGRLARLRACADLPTGYRWHERIIRSGGGIGVLVGLALAAFLFAFGEPLCAVAGIVAALGYGAVLLLHIIGRPRLAEWLLFFWTAALSILGQSALGWQAGFQYYLLALLCQTLAAPCRDLKLRLLYAFAVCAFAGAAYLADMLIAPFSALTGQALSLLGGINLAAGMAILGRFALYFTAELGAASARAADAEARLDDLTHHDSLTGLPNRRAMLERLAMEEARARRFHGGFVVAIGNMDGFKRYNDQWGNDCGDLVITSAARTLQKPLRTEDWLARWGGEEFLILLTGTNAEGARLALDRLRIAVESLRLEYEGHALEVTLTIGFATWHPDEKVDQTLARADAYLYQGKKAGKNCVTG